MATDIRRMTREELDELNRRAKEWRSRNAKPIPDEKPENNQHPETREQMDLWSANGEES